MEQNVCFICGWKMQGQPRRCTCDNVYCPAHGYAGRCEYCLGADNPLTRMLGVFRGGGWVFKRVGSDRRAAQYFFTRDNADGYQAYVDSLASIECSRIVIIADAETIDVRVTVDF